MHDGTFGMLGRNPRMVLLAMGNRLFQFVHAFIQMRIDDFFLSHLRVA